MRKRKGLLKVEAAHVGTPDWGEVGNAGATPPEPEGLRLTGLLAGVWADD